MSAASSPRTWFVWACAALCCCALLGAATGRAADADPELVEVMRQLAARPSAQATFVEKKTLSVLSKPIESSGELRYEAPGRLETRTIKPRAETLSLADGQLGVQRGGRRYSMPLREHPEIAPFIDSIRATLAGDLAALQKSYELAFKGPVDNWSLRLLPRDPQIAGRVVRIDLRGVGGVLREVTIETMGGDRSVMAIRELGAP